MTNKWWLKGDANADVQGPSPFALSACVPHAASLPIPPDRLPHQPPTEVPPVEEEEQEEAAVEDDEEVGGGVWRN